MKFGSKWGENAGLGGTTSDGEGRPKMGPNRADLGNLGSVGAGSDGIGAVGGRWGPKVG